MILSSSSCSNFNYLVENNEIENYDSYHLYAIGSLWNKSESLTKEIKKNKKNERKKEKKKEVDLLCPSSGTLQLFSCIQWLSS